eukprot:RCo054098
MCGAGAREAFPGTTLREGPPRSRLRFETLLPVCGVCSEEVLPWAAAPPCMQSPREPRFAWPPCTWRRKGVWGRMPLFRAAALRAPFLDLLGVLTNPELPLVHHDAEEWGEPRGSPEDYRHLAKFSPYENLSNVRGRFPDLFLSGCADDPFAPWWNALKYVAQARA